MGRALARADCAGAREGAARMGAASAWAKGMAATPKSAARGPAPATHSTPITCPSYSVGMLARLAAPSLTTTSWSGYSAAIAPMELATNGAPVLTMRRARGVSGSVLRTPTG